MILPSKSKSLNIVRMLKFGKKRIYLKLKPIYWSLMSSINLHDWVNWLELRNKSSRIYVFLKSF